MQRTVPSGIALEDLIDLACAAWKVRRQVSGCAAGETNLLAPLVASICDSLFQSGIEIQDHTGQSFDPAQALEVLAFEPAPNVACPMVVDTLRPTIYWQGKKVLTGLVVVVTPASATTPTHLQPA